MAEGLELPMARRDGRLGSQSGHVRHLIPKHSCRMKHPVRLPLHEQQRQMNPQPQQGLAWESSGEQPRGRRWASVGAVRLGQARGVHGGSCGSPARGWRSQISGLLRLKRSGSSVINCRAALQISPGTAVFDVWGRRPARDFPPLLGLILSCLSQPFDCKALQINLLSHRQTADSRHQPEGRRQDRGLGEVQDLRVYLQ